MDKGSVRRYLTYKFRKKGLEYPNIKDLFYIDGEIKDKSGTHKLVNDLLKFNFWQLLTEM